MSQMFASPAKYVQGRGATESIGEYATTLGSSALLLGDSFVLDLVETPVRESLEAAGLSLAAEEFGGECSKAEIDRLGDEFDDVGADIVIGAGGGKALDTAKAIREERDAAMVAMPTIASTDAPTSALSVIYSEDGEFEEYLFLDDHPDLVLVDTEAIAGAPTRFFTSGIGDALATWFEADATYRSDGDNILGEKPTEAAHSLARLCYDTLRDHGVSAVEGVEAGAVTDSVEAVTEANTLLSGLGFESGGLAAAHSVHNGLTQLEATHEATHGEKVNVGTLTQLVLEGRDDAVVEDLIEFSLEVDLPVTLADIGIDDPESADLDLVAETACDENETIHNEPFAVEPAMVRDALLTADRMGHRVKDRR